MEAHQAFLQQEKTQLKSTIKNEADDGVSIEGHEVGNIGDYSGANWDNASGTSTNSFGGSEW